MNTPRSLAAILVLGALTAPALAQSTGGSNNSPSAADQQSTSNNQQPTGGNQQTSGNNGQSAGSSQQTSGNNQQTTGNQGASGQPGSGSSTPQLPGGTAGPNNTAAAGAGPAVVQNPTAEVQQRLQQLGLYKGDVDGKWGPQTRSAVVEFQRSHGLQPTGTLNVATVARLNQATQGPNPNQEPNTEAGAAGTNNSALANSPAARRRGMATTPGLATLPGTSTTARATVTGPGMGFDTGTSTNTAPGGGGGSNGRYDFFGTTLDLSNGFNAATGRR
jgi:peptidoglycan hydrolase-like protein with peptidoglycan-binding domain